MSGTLVDPTVSRRKLQRDYERWKAHSQHAERGWVLLDYDEDALTVELAFLTRASISSGSVPLAVVACAVRLSYDNYDIWPPSLTFIDAIGHVPIAMPHVQAMQPSPTGPKNVLIATHPETRLPFLCVPGIREYHTHPQHSGDSWLLYRSRGEGSLLTVCDRIWHYMVRNVFGFRIEIQALPQWPLRAQFVMSLVQGEISTAGNPPPPAVEGGPGRLS
ncbi:MAG: putative metal-binding protein [Gemmatimonadaceae bacterium]